MSTTGANECRLELERVLHNLLGPLPSVCQCSILLKVRGNNLLICEVKRKASYLEKDVLLFTILFSIMYMYIISYTCTVYHCLHVHTFAVVAVCVCVY